MLLPTIEYCNDDTMDVIVFHGLKQKWLSHNHPDVFQIVMVLSGRMEAQCKDRSLVLEEDDYIVVPPYYAHSECATESSSTLYVSVSKELLAENPEEKINNLFESLYQDGTFTRSQLNNINKAASQMLLSPLHEERGNALVWTVLAILEDKPEDDSRIRDIAEIVAIDKDHLARQFKHQFGISPYRYRLQHRIKIATELLRDTNLPIAEIATSCGFYDNSHFRHQFNNFTGFSPNDFRTMFRKAKLINSHKT